MYRLIRIHPPLMINAALMVLLTAVSVAGLVLDDRVLLGAPIWLKPLKFAISVAIYSVTLAWLISLVTRGRRIASAMGTVIAAATFIELVVIVGQVVRGRRSHFNFATPLDGTLFTIMAVTIVVLWVATAIVAVLLITQRIGDRVPAYAVRASMIIALAGLGVGFLMTSPQPGQIETIQNGGEQIIGAHAVGVADGGPGLPLVNWSTIGGDLRIGHFIGMHALQALPLLALALTLLGRRWRRLADETVRLRLVITGSIAYAGLTVLVTWQALRGQSIVAPDALTWTAAAAIGLVALAGAGWAFAARREPAGPAGRTTEDAASSADLAAAR